MKTALIIGLTGNFGLQMAESLLKRGWRVRALMRDVSKVPAQLKEELSADAIVKGDAMKFSDVSKAAKGCDVIIYAANPAYHKWHQQALQMLEPAVRCAEQQGLRFVLPGNVYNFSPNSMAIDEGFPQNPPTDKGELRIQMEKRLQRAGENGAKILIVRAGDFLGPNNHMSWLDFTLKGKKTAGSSSSRWVMAMPHDEQHTHFWSYLPDVCENTVSLLEVTAQSFAVYHDPGLKLTTRDWQNAFVENGLSLKVKKFPWWGFRLLALVSPVVKEVCKMRYLWQNDLLLDGAKMKNELGVKYQATEFSNVLGAVLKLDNTVEIGAESAVRG